MVYIRECNPICFSVYSNDNSTRQKLSVSCVYATSSKYSNSNPLHTLEKIYGLIGKKLVRIDRRCFMGQVSAGIKIK